MITVLGIDPGLDGFLVAIGQTGPCAWPMPVLGSSGSRRVLDGAELARLIGQLDATSGIDYALIEKAQVIPRQSAQSAAKTGQNYGRILGLLDAFGVPYEEVTPQAWKREIGLPRRGAAVSGKVKGQRKRDAIELAQRLFPSVDLRKNEKCRIKHDGKAEALLIAEVARRRFNERRGM